MGSFSASFLILFLSSLHWVDAEVCIPNTTNHVYEPTFQCPRMSDASNATFCCRNRTRSIFLFCCTDGGLSIHRNHPQVESSVDYRVRLFVQVASVFYLLILVVLFVADLSPKCVRWRRRREYRTTGSLLVTTTGGRTVRTLSYRRALTKAPPQTAAAELQRNTKRRW